MDNTVYNYGHIGISPYEFEEINDLKVTKTVDEHALLYVSGIVPEEKVDEYVENSNENERICVYINGDNGSELVFQGMPSKISIKAEGNVRRIELTAISLTFLMDIKKKKLTFQDKGKTYSSIFSELTAGYENASVIDEASGGQSIGGLIVQYEETDWAFIKRLASHFNAPLVPVCEQQGLKYYVGVQETTPKYSIDEFNYSITRDIKDYKFKSENAVSGISVNNATNYEITTNKVLKLCSTVKFKDSILYVYKAEIEMKDGVLENKYILRDKKGLSVPRIDNYGIIGASLFGHIAAVAKDTVKVNLDIDSTPGSMWFPYSTVYSSPDGSGWYCMPEVGDKVRVYFPDDKESNAFAASSVNLKSSNSQSRSNPDEKSLSTKYGKQIVFKPGAVEINGGGGMLMRLTDDGGIEINSSKKITLSAAEDIEINGGGNVMVSGDEGVNLKQKATSLDIKDDVKFTGGKVNIQ